MLTDLFLLWPRHKKSMHIMSGNNLFELYTSIPLFIPENAKDLMRTSELYDQDIEGSAVPANATRVAGPTYLGTTLLHSRSDMIPQEANGKSDIQSGRTMIELEKSTSLPLGHNLHQGNHYPSIRDELLRENFCYNSHMPYRL